MTGPVYRGVSRAIKVSPCVDVTPEPFPIGGVAGQYGGVSRAIKTLQNVGPMGSVPSFGSSGPVYGGVSRAIKTLLDCCCEAEGIIPFDDFNRTEAGIWDAATPTGYLWVLTTTDSGTPGTGVPSVNGTHGLLEATKSTNGTRSHIMEISGEGPFSADSFVMTSVFHFSAQGAGGKTARLRFRVALASQLGLNFVTNVTGTLGFMELIQEGNLQSGSNFQFPLTPSVDYKVKWEHCFGVLSRAKVWQADTDEPEDWGVERDAEGEDTSPTGFRVQSDVTRSLGASTPFTNIVAIDYINMDTCE